MSFTQFVFLSLAITTISIADTADKQWILSTSDTRLIISVSENHPVIISLTDAGKQHNWAVKPMPVPLMSRIWVDEHEYSTDWKYKTGKYDKSSGKLILTFTNDRPQMVLRSIWRARPGRGPIEHWIEIENMSGLKVTLSHQDSLTLQSLAAGEKANVWWIRRGATSASSEGGTFVQPITSELDLNLQSDFSDGSSPVPWMAVQVGNSRGLYVGWEFTGFGRVHANAGPGPEDLHIDVGNNPDFKTDVMPGETFLVPPAFVGCYTGDIDEGSHSLHRFIIEKLRPSIPKRYPDPVLSYCLWSDGTAGNWADVVWKAMNQDEATVLRVAGLARDMGFEQFLPDAMWYAGIGDWRWDPKRFPRGVEPIEEYVHKHGMKMALWSAWTMGGTSDDPGALNTASHPDWFSGGAAMCLACKEAKEWAIEKTQSLVKNNMLDYLKHDSMLIIPSCDKTTHRHGYGVDVTYWATMGYYEVQEKLRKTFPHLVLENCSSGGHMKDFGIIQRTHYTTTTDDLSNLADRQSIYDSTFAFPPIILQAYTMDTVYQKRGDELGSFFWRSAMMGSWQMLPFQSSKWTDEQKESVRRATDTYKKRLRPIIKDAKVHHILPRPDGANWDGIFYYSEKCKRGVVYIFRPDSGDDVRTVKLKGLNPDKTYKVWSEDGSVTVENLTGATLMNSGLVIRLPDRYTSDLIYIDEAGVTPQNPLLVKS